MKAIGKNFNLDTMNIDAIWQCAQIAEQQYVAPSREKYNPFSFFRARYTEEGDINQTYAEIGAMFGCNGSYARSVVVHAERMIMYAFLTIV